MSRGLLLCAACRKQVSVLAGTIFQDTHLPLKVWFQAIWFVTKHKGGLSARKLQQLLRLGNYKTAWQMLHKLRQAMGSNEEKLRGVVEVDRTSYDAPGGGRILIAVAAEREGRGIGRIRIGRIRDLERRTLRGFVLSSVEPGITLCTNRKTSFPVMGEHPEYKEMAEEPQPGQNVLPRVYKVVSQFKGRVTGVHRGAIESQHFDGYVNEFVFRFNARNSVPGGRLFFHLARRAVQTGPVTYEGIVRPHEEGG